MEVKSTGKICSLWPFFGILWSVLAFLNPYIGYYAFSDLAVLLMALWVYSTILKRFGRNNDNQDVLRKMSRKQKEAYAKADVTEARSQLSLSQSLIPAVTLAALVLNGYTWYYYASRNVFCSFLTADILANPSFLAFLFALSAIGATGFLLGFKSASKQMIEGSTLS